MIQAIPEIIIPHPTRYECVRASKAMTIGICARCMDGAVLMSDRQITKEGGLKYYQRKTWSFSTGAYHVSSVYAGIPEMAKAFQLEFKHALPANPYSWKPNQDDLQNLIRTCLRTLWKEHGRDMQLEMLMCTWTLGSKYELWRSSGKVLAEANLECIGVGDSSVIRYLFDTFVWKGRWLELQYFVPLGLYVMDQAKKYIEGCGGRTDCIIFKLGQIMHPSDSSIREIEEQMESLEAQVVSLFENYADLKLSEQDFSKIMEKFAAHIEHIRNAGKLSRLLD